jgi:hypothetical protein
VIARRWSISCGRRSRYCLSRNRHPTGNGHPSRARSLLCCAAPRGDRRRSGKRYGVAAAHRARALLGNPEEEARAHPRLGPGGARPGLPHCGAGPGMSRAIQDATVCREALARLPELGLGELRQHGEPSIKPIHHLTSAASCCCALLRTGCRKWHSAVCARSDIANSANLLGSLKTAERGGYALARS